MKEEWKPIEDFEKYEISTLGNVRRSDNHKPLKVSHSKRPIKENRRDPYRYGTVTVRNTEISKSCKVHRLVALAFIPNPHNYPHVNHINGDKFDNSMVNLEWIMPSANQVHALEIGINTNTGERAYCSKLTKEQVEQIIRIGKTGALKQRQIAECFGVARQQISRIIRGQRWKYALREA
jgi:predicted XRE-type DNA-binding protein